MTPEERLYTLMAHAEDLQTHAQTLQFRTKKALEGLPEIVRDAGDEIRAQTVHLIWIGIAIVLAVGIIMGFAVSAYFRYDLSSLRAEANALRTEIAEMQQTEADLTSKTWGLTLATWDDIRGIVLPQGMDVKGVDKLSDNSGRRVIIVTP